MVSSHTCLYVEGMTTVPEQPSAQQAERKLFRADMAELAGVQYRSLSARNLPPEDGREPQGAYNRPFWWESTARKWARDRPGQGSRTDLKRAKDSHAE